MQGKTRWYVSLVGAGSSILISLAAQAQEIEEQDLGVERVIGVRLYDMLSSEATGATASMRRRWVPRCRPP